MTRGVPFLPVVVTSPAYRPDRAVGGRPPYNRGDEGVFVGAIVAVANQKGGVAKTTTVHALGAALADRGHRVLLVDLDPQACLTYAVGVDADALDLSLHDVMVGRAKADEVLVELDALDLLPATIDLAGAEVHLLTKTGREFVLARALRPIAGDYDFTFVDCGPSLGILTIDGLTAASHVLVPFQAETLSDRGVGQLLETIEDVRSYTNEGLEILGAVATMYDSRTRLGREVLEGITERHGLEVLPPPIPRSIRVAEAPGRGRSILDHAPRSKPAEAYRRLAETIEGRL